MDRKSEERAILVAIAVVMVVLLVWGLAVFRHQRATEEAVAKAGELIAAFEQKGFPVPTQDQVVRTLGDDGGAVCATASSDNAQALLSLSLAVNAGNPGARPIIVDADIFEGERLVVQIYCPNELPRFEEFVSELETADTVPL